MSLECLIVGVIIQKRAEGPVAGRDPGRGSFSLIQALRLTVTAWLLALGSLSAGVMPAPTPLPGEANRLIVKVKPALAQGLEASLDGTIPEVRSGSVQNPAAQGFLSRHALTKITPLHPDLIRLRQQQGWSEAQLADHLRGTRAVRATRARPSSSLPEISRTYVIHLPGSSQEERLALLKRLQTDPEVEFAEPDRGVTTSNIPNDPYLSSVGSWGKPYADLWGHFAINAPAAWNTTIGTGVVVAVIDTGLDPTHPDIAANIWTNPREIAGNGLDDDGNGLADDIQGWDFIGPDASNPVQSNHPLDHHGHGTHVAGTIAATGNNALGIPGVAWGAKVMPVKALDDHGLGWDSTLAPAIRYAANSGADIINASWGGSGTSQAITEAVQYATGLGVVFVAAAGNSGDDALNMFPANILEAITVAAAGPGNTLSGFSNYGTKIDVAAPGVDILSLRASGVMLGPLVGTQYMRLSGTSMAAPHVSGVVALLLSRNPNLSVEDVRQILRGSAAPQSGVEWSPDFGPGILDAQSALSLTGVLQTRITSPPGGGHAVVPLPIIGFAKGADFSHYILDYGAGMIPSTWVTIQTGTARVDGGLLGTFDPRGIPDGSYTLRLRSFRTDGRVFSDRILLTVDYVSILNPEVPKVPVMAAVFKPGAGIPVIGTATGASFQRYSILWARGISPVSGWSQVGVSLVGNGQSQMTETLLGSWDTTGIQAAGYFTLRIQVENAGFTSHADTLVYLEPDLLSFNWPQIISPLPGISSGFMPVVNPSGDTSLVLVSAVTAWDLSTPGRLWRYAPDGALQGSLSLPLGSYANPSVGDLDESPGQEVISSSTGFEVAIVHPDNSLSTLAPPGGVRRAFSPYSVILDDLEGNSQVGLAAAGYSYFTGVLDAYAWRRDGTCLDPSPGISVPDLNQAMGFGNTKARVLVGDFYGNGIKELLVVKGPSPSTYQLGLFALDGTPLAWGASELPGAVDAVVLADLDHNGKLETIVADSNLLLHVFQPDGTERPGWPKALSLDIPEHVVVVGDLDKNGVEEIVVKSQHWVEVFEPDGTLFSSAWPLAMPLDSLLGQPLALADINGDGYQEILVMQQQLLLQSGPLFPTGLSEPPRAGNLQANLQVEVEPTPEGPLSCWVEPSVHPLGYPDRPYSTNTLVAYDHHGAVSRSWNLPGISGRQPTGYGTVTVGDFSQSGHTEIAVTYPLIEGGGTGGFLMKNAALVLSTGAPHVAGVDDWPMIHHDLRNSATLSRRQPASDFRLSAPATAVGIVPGQQSSLTLAITPLNGFRSAVTLACSGLPAGVSCTFSPSSVTPPGTVATSLLTLTATSQAVINVPSFTVVASSGGLARSIPVAISVSDFTVAVAPIAPTIIPGGSAIITCEITPMQGFNGPVSFSCTGLPANVTAAFSPVAVTPQGGAATSTLTIRDTTYALQPGASLPITVTATGAGQVHTASARLDVMGFAVSIHPAQTSVNPGGTRTFTGVLTPMNGFQDRVSLTCLELPAGFQGVFVPDSIVPNGSPANFTFTVTAPSAIPAINPTVFSVSASGGGVSEWTELSLTVSDFTMGMATATPAVKAGGSATVTCSVAPLRGFDGTVSLSCLGLPSDVQASFSPAVVTPSGGPVTSVMTLTASTSMAALKAEEGQGSSSGSHAFGGLIWLALRDVRKRRRPHRKPWLLGAAMLLLMVQASCGGGGSSAPLPPPPPPKTYTITVMASAGTLSHSQTLTLTVNP